MIAFPHCKINLGLRVLGKRTDGYHDLETVFYPVRVHDIVESVRSGEFSFSSSGIALDPVPGNLCVKAYHLVKSLVPSLPPVAIHLHKLIPPGSGLGGGSSDAVRTLLLMDQSFHLGLGQKELLTLATQLGSDCPFFLHKGPCLAKGRGDLLEPVELDLGSYHLVLVCPAVSISTAQAYGLVQPTQRGNRLADLMERPIEEWKGRVENDFELPVFSLYPELGAIKARLYEEGAIYSSLTGSGSAVYGIFPASQIPSLEWAIGYTLFSGKLLGMGDEEFI